MELNININLSDEDIKQGLTAYDIVDMLFPAEGQPQTVTEFANHPEQFVEEPEVEIQEEEPVQEAVQETAVSNNNEQQEEVNTEPAPGSLPPRDDDPLTVELDSAGVPWDSEIHSSGKSQYKSGPDKGRWVWKRGSVPEERERIARVLKEEVERARSKSGGDTNE